MADLPSGIKKLGKYCEGFLEAFYAVEAGMSPPEHLEGEALDDYKRSCRNQAIATEKEKAELVGTISDAPTIRLEDLTALGLNTKKAEEIISECQRIRTEALVLAK
jgi:hypothetical protein